nr:LysR family transcriptional regulator [Pseudomonas sp.]
MDELKCLRMFLEVARRKSFSGAAQHFGVAPASATKQVAWLERSLNAKLLNRTTKQIELTPAGLQVVERAAGVLERYEDLRDAVSNLSGEVTGVVRVGLPPSFGTKRFLPVITGFYERYPNIQISLSSVTVRTEERFGAQGLDVGIIITTGLRDATYIALPLAHTRQAVVASPAYLRRHPPIREPEDLLGCNCLISSTKSPTGRWHFTGPGGPVAIGVQGSLRSDFGDALKEAALTGLGVSMHPYYMVAEEIEQGLLQVVLPDYEPPALEIYAVYSSRANLPLRVRIFLDYLKEWAQKPKAWTTLNLPHTTST